MRAICYGLALLVAGACLWIALSVAHAHGPAEWIQRGGFKNAAGELCCGERDCFGLTDADVKITSAGYYVVSIKETVPFSEATPTWPGAEYSYWRCQWGGSRKCFFAPLTSGWMNAKIRFAQLVGYTGTL
ncbi:MAG: hypothetical protein V4474_00940 [Patescibacteria group bacterium]